MNRNWDAATEARFQESIDRETANAFRIAAFVGSFLFPASSFLDWFTQHPHFVALSWLRYLTAVSYFLLYLLARKGKVVLSPNFSAFLLILLASVCITLMCVITGGYASRYYAGILIIFVAATVFIPWGPKQATLSAVWILVFYYLVMLIQARFVIADAEVFINNATFLFESAGTMICGAYFGDTLRRNSFARLIEVEHAREDLKRNDQIKTRFFANVSHELRTPLTLILGPARSLAEDPEVGRRYGHDLEMIRRNANLLLKHVEDLLNVAKLDARSMALRYSTVDVAAEGRALAESFSGVAKERGIRFVVRAPSPLVAEVDPEKLSQILINLLSNAFKFAPSGGQVRCEISKEDGLLRIVVADSGPGIPPELREAVFERFFQAEESTKRKYGGTGLGLSIVKDFVRLHRGTISVGDAPEGGAEMSAVLPVRAPEGAAVSEAKAPKAEPVYLGELLGTRAQERSDEGIAQPANAPRVLLIEDNPDVREYVARMLRPGYRVETAAGVSEGLEILAREKPDLILSDVMMPGESGVDLVRLVRERRELDSIPIVMLTAKADEDLRVELLRQGVQDYILKPFSPEELRARVSNLISFKRSKEILRDQLKGKDGALESLAGEVVSALSTRDDFISIASHELKTPITSMKLQNDLVLRQIEKTPESVDFKRYCLRQEEQLARLHRLVDDMLDISQIESGRLKMELEPLGLDQLAKDVLSRMAEQLSAAGIEVKTAFQTDVVGRWDRRKIEQIMSNLISNAIKYAPGRPLEVRVFKSGQTAFFQLADHGPGIARADLNRIFERFERVVPYKNVSGFGLGLFIARKLAEAHHGAIEVESELGKGSTFTIGLPASAV